MILAIIAIYILLGLVVATIGVVALSAGHWKGMRDRTVADWIFYFILALLWPIPIIVILYSTASYRWRKLLDGDSNED